MQYGMGTVATLLTYLGPQPISRFMGVSLLYLLYCTVTYWMWIFEAS